MNNAFPFPAPSIALLSGPPGSGKSQYAARSPWSEAGERSPAIVSLSLTRRLLSDRDSYLDKALEDWASALASALLQTRARYQRPTILDAPHATAAEIFDIERCVWGAGLPAYLVGFNASLEHCLKRATCPPEITQRLHESFQEEALPIIKRHLNPQVADSKHTPWKGAIILNENLEITHATPGLET